MTKALLDSDRYKEMLGIEDAYIDANGYERCSSKRYVHREIAAHVLKRPLKKGEVVHHVDGDRGNNNPSNLVICQDQKYHMILHARQRIVELGGSPEEDAYCWSCKTLHKKTSFARLVTAWNGVANSCRERENARKRRAKYKDKRETISVRERTLRMMAKRKHYYEKTGQGGRACWLW